MPSLADEAFEWLDRAEQAREVAEQLTDPSARNAVKQLAESFERLARAAVTPAALRRRELTSSAREEARKFFCPVHNQLRWGGKGWIHCAPANPSGRAFGIRFPHACGPEGAADQNVLAQRQALAYSTAIE